MPSESELIRDRHGHTTSMHLGQVAPGKTKPMEQAQAQALPPQQGLPIINGRPSPPRKVEFQLFRE
jgi:hypothetical protein